MPQTDHSSYRDKKAFFDSLLTIYGRKPVLEALRDTSIPFYRLHLAESNKPAPIIRDIIATAEQRDIPIEYHSKQALSRISKNSKQDQGVAADLRLPHYQTLEQFLATQRVRPFSLLALDNITNPQNLGMIIRSATAGYVDGILLPAKGCAALSPLVIKASAGTVFKAHIVRCQQLGDALNTLKQNATTIAALSSHADDNIFDNTPTTNHVYVLGNETDGVSPAIQTMADKRLSIPMNNKVESLNVAVTAALIAYANINQNAGDPPP